MQHFRVAYCCCKCYYIKCSELLGFWRNPVWSLLHIHAEPDLRIQLQSPAEREPPVDVRGVLRVLEFGAPPFVELFFFVKFELCFSSRPGGEPLCGDRARKLQR